MLSAAAATLAAVLAAVTLYATGRRETRKWLRDSLLEHYVQFLTSSFSSAGDRGYRARLHGDAAKLRPIADRARQAYRDGTDTLTHLRILAPRDVVSAAEQLHLLDARVSAAALGSDPLPDAEAWNEMRRAQRAARAAMLAEIRKSLGLDEAAPIGRFPKEIGE